MIQLQLGLAICLTASAAFSGVLLYLNRTKDAEISLPTHAGADDEANETVTYGDPFDVIKPDDLSEGQPIDEQAFWFRVRSSALFMFSNVLFFGQMKQRKIVLSLLLATTSVIETSSFCFSAVAHDKKAMVIYVLRALFAVYTLALAVRSIKQLPHFESIVHISALTFVVATLLFVTLIIPSANLPAVYASSNESG